MMRHFRKEIPATSPLGPMNCSRCFIFPRRPAVIASRAPSASTSAPAGCPRSSVPRRMRHEASAPLPSSLLGRVNPHRSPKPQGHGEDPNLAVWFSNSLLLSQPVWVNMGYILLSPALNHDCFDFLSSFSEGNIDRSTTPRPVSVPQTRPKARAKLRQPPRPEALGPRSGAARRSATEETLLENWAR